MLNKELYDYLLLHFKYVKYFDKFLNIFGCSDIEEVSIYNIKDSDFFISYRMENGICIDLTIEKKVKGELKVLQHFDTFNELFKFNIENREIIQYI